MPTKLLSELKPGDAGQVEALNDDEGVGQRLQEMGITRGAPIEVVRFAPMGDPIDIKVRGYHLSLRHQEAELIQVSLP